MNNKKETRMESIESLSKVLGSFNGSVVCSNSQDYFLDNSWPLASSYAENTKVYNFNDGQHSEKFNWLPLCKANPKLCFKVARAIFNSQDDNLPEFFSKTVASFLAAIFAHISSLKLATPADVYDLVVNSSLNELVSILEGSENPIARNCSKLFSPFNRRVYTSVLSLLEQKLAFLQNDQVRNITSTSSISPDFSLLKQQQTLILWLVPKEQTRALQPLTNLFFALLSDQLDKAKGNLSVDILPNCNYSNGAFSLSEEEMLYRLPIYNQLLIGSQTTNAFNRYSY